MQNFIVLSLIVLNTSDIGPPLVEKSSAAARLGRAAFGKPATLRKNHPPSYVVWFLSRRQIKGFILLCCSFFDAEEGTFCSRGSLIFSN